MVPFILNFKKGKPHRKLFTSYGIDTSDTPPNSKSASAFSNSAQNIDSPTKGHRRTKSVGTIGRNNPLKKIRPEVPIVVRDPDVIELK